MRQNAEIAAGGPLSVIWHEVECGGYAADLALWRQLAGEAGGPVLELGCGAGRVALDLARAGHEVTGVDVRPELLAELRNRAAAVGTAVEALDADARSFELGRRFALVLAPMQLVHLLRGAHGRRAMLGCARRHLAPGGTLALALLPPDIPAAAGGDTPPTPDVREVGGWVYSSLPLQICEVDGAIEVRRLRQVVAPDGELSEELDVARLDLLDPDTVAAEARRARLAERERVEIAATADHVGSTVLVLESAERGGG
ncbi:MAG: class I SAM-dependent methyltransferase [Solirubrobacterales bacterium]